VREGVPREDHRHHGRSAVACQADEGPRPRRRGITPAVDRLSRDTTDLLVIAREMQRAGAGIRSLAEPYLDTTSDFWRQIRPQADPDPASAERGPHASRSWRNATRRCPQLQCQSEHDFTAHSMNSMTTEDKALLSEAFRIYNS
jgi:hypothetical protein